MHRYKITHADGIPISQVKTLAPTYPQMELPDVPSYWDTFMSNVMHEFYQKKEDLIKSRMIVLGFNPDDHQWIKDNCQSIIVEGEYFEHLYYHFDQPDEVRIISFKISPDPLPELSLLDKDYSTRMNITQQYY